MPLRKAVFWLHLATGTVAGTVILVMSLTGVFLAFGPQILAYAERDRRTVTPPASDASRLPLDVVVARARAARPGARRPTGVAWWPDSRTTVRVSFGGDDAVFVNAYTGEIVGAPSKTRAALHAIEDWHRWLGSRDVGRPITGACNAAFLGLAVTGFYLWWPRMWSRRTLAAVMILDPRLHGRARDFNWHNSIGFWCALVLVIVTLTGVIMSYQWASNLLYVLTGNEPPPVPAGPAPRGARPDDRAGAERVINFDALRMRAEQQVPGWVAINLRLPTSPTAEREALPAKRL